MYKTYNIIKLLKVVMWNANALTQHREGLKLFTNNHNLVITLSI